MKDALLIVNVGASAARAQATVTAVETAFMNEVPEIEVFRAVTSPAIRRHLAEQGEEHLGVEEVLVQLRTEGYERVIVQPTFLLYGREYDEMLDILKMFVHDFEEIVLGKPLLAGPQELMAVADCLNYYYGTRNEAIVLMGHGTDHVANMTYLAFQEILRRRGFLRAYVGTLNGWPKIGDVIPELKKAGETDVLLVPMMLAPGKHALDDMAGDGEGSWKSILEAEGFKVSCHMSGFGVLPEVQDIYCRHLREVMKELN